jgi:Na+/alanine symporter
VELERDLRRIVVAIVGAVITFCLVALAIYYKMADVAVNGFVHGGPATLAAGMAGLFGGGVAAVVVLILLLRWR